MRPHFIAVLSSLCLIGVGFAFGGEAGLAAACLGGSGVGYLIGATREALDNNTNTTYADTQPTEEA